MLALFAYQKLRMLPLKAKITQFGRLRSRKLKPSQMPSFWRSLTLVAFIWVTSVSGCRKSRSQTTVLHVKLL